MRDSYQMEYIGGIEIEDLNPGYKVSFNLDRSENPLVIISDLSDEEFIPFIKEELRYRKLHRVKHYLTGQQLSKQNNCCGGTNRQNRLDHCRACI